MLSVLLSALQADAAGSLSGGVHGGGTNLILREDMHLYVLEMFDRFVFVINVYIYIHVCNCIYQYVAEICIYTSCWHIVVFFNSGIWRWHHHVPGNSLSALFGMVSSRDPNSKVVNVTSNVWGSYKVTNLHYLVGDIDVWVYQVSNHSFYQVSNETNPGWLVYIGGGILPSYIGIMIKPL